MRDRGYWRYPAEGLHVVGIAEVTLKCAECGSAREVPVSFSGIDPDFIALAIDAAGWTSTDHTVLCSQRCYDATHEWKP